MAGDSRIDDGFRERVTDFGEEVVALADELPSDRTTNHLGHQMMRAGTSVGAHIREASRARSDREFVSKLDGAIQEADETQYWLEILARTDRAPKERLRGLYRETDELLRMATSTVIKVKQRL